ncbi:hypothetical protein I350_04917 [Cryptococcus amylolentus CBS 6273]|uniref:N-acetyltransferase domain-containing protein n=1 Tax=Cryptococcus amylolentus CBS 6273 TaxID=1296118 RepID=A0A1E3JYJ9_9TREE|nr:hypothetical protein I350_04917 [Cryptococcus amylolentus CBS 6273]
MLLNPEQFTIRPATDGQALQHGKACFEVTDWRARMSLEDFNAIAEREQSDAEYAKDHGVIGWVLVRWDGHRTKCFIKDKGQGQVRDGWVYVITAVVTPHKHRGQGYATHLIRLLHYILTSPSPTITQPAISQAIPPFPPSWGQRPPPIPHELVPYVPRADGSMLWSDVLMRVYERCTLGLKGRGFQSKQEWNHTLTWKLNGSPESQSDWEFIWESDLEDIYPVVSANSRHKLSQAQTTDKPAFLCDPASPGTLTMIPVRGSYSPQPTWRTRVLPYGIRLKATKGQGWEHEAVVLFSLYNSAASPRLCVTYMQNITPGLLPSLLASLDGVIQYSGAPWTEGEVWGLDPTSELVHAWNRAEGRDVVVSTRIGTEAMAHVLGVCWYDEEEVDMVDSQMWAWV